jgi:hypothetical protein
VRRQRSEGFVEQPYQQHLATRGDAQFCRGT